jgi:predicted RNA-binding Zn-ribbon protein involved in translation (DUF1610 family)
MLTDPIVLAGSACAVAGAALLVAGLRGRRVEGVRECARCGQATDPAAETAAAATCPECGLDLTRRSAVRQRRARSRATAWAGGLVLAAGLAVGGTGVWANSANFDPWPHCPEPVLALVFEHGTAGLAAKATAEYRARLDANALSAQAETRLAAILSASIGAASSDPLAWDPAWDALLETLRAKGRIADAAWGAFVSQAIDLRLLLPAKVRVGSQVAYGLGHTERAIQFRPFGNTSASATWNVLSLEIADVLIGEDRRSGLVMRTAFGSALGGGSGSQQASALLPTLPLGKTKARARVAVEIFDGPIGSTALLLSKTVELVGEVEVVAADAPILEVVRDEAIGKELRDAISIERATTRPAQGGRTLVELAFAYDAVPTDAAFEVIVRRRDGASGAEEIRFSTLTVRARNQPGLSASGSNVHDLAPGRYDVILRPSVKLAEESVGFTSAWDGPDIVFEGVEFAAPGLSVPAAPPSTLP